MREVNGYFSHHEVIAKGCVLEISVESLSILVAPKKEYQ